VRESVAAALARHNAAAPASSTRVTRALILPEPPKREAGEITDKGTINQRRALDLRAASVQALYAGELGPDVLTPLTRVQAAAR
jgi:feruloyl-CoA synthase